MALKIGNGLDLQNTLITNVGSPSAATDAANKNYVDNLITGLAWKQPVRAATTANIASLAGGAPSTLDGVTLVLNDRVLVKNQTTQAQNGIYTVTTVGTGANGTWARATDADSTAELRNATVYISEGTTQADTSYVQTQEVTTVGTTNVVFAQTGGGVTYSAGNGLGLSSNTFSVTADPVSGGGISVTASGVKVDTAVVVRKYAANIGNGALTSIAVVHNLGTQDITWSLRDVSGNAFQWTDGVATDANTLTLTFATAPATNSLRVVVHG